MNPSWPQPPGCAGRRLDSGRWTSAALRELDGGTYDLVVCDVHLGPRSSIDLFHAAGRRYPAFHD